MTCADMLTSMQKQLEHNYITLLYPKTFTLNMQAYFLCMHLGSSTNKLDDFAQVMISFVATFLIYNRNDHPATLKFVPLSEIA